MIYTSEHFAAALLEKLVRSRRMMPPNQHFIRIAISRGKSHEMFLPERHPGWDANDATICRAIGEEWLPAGRSALLIVPSIPARIGRNVPIDPRHPDAVAIRHELPQPVSWDEWLYG